MRDYTFVGEGMVNRVAQGVTDECVGALCDLLETDDVGGVVADELD